MIPDDRIVATLTVGELREVLTECVSAPAPATAFTLLDRAGLALALGCSPATVDRLRADGCPELRLGDAPRFELEAVLGWLRGRGAGLRLVAELEAVPARLGRGRR